MTSGKDAKRDFNHYSVWQNEDTKNLFPFWVYNVVCNPATKTVQSDALKTH